MSHSNPTIPLSLSGDHQNFTKPAIFKPEDDFRNAIAAIVDSTVDGIKRFVSAIHNRCPLVVYINKAGRLCSQFVKRAAFSGYHFEFSGGTATVTNLETGKQYKVKTSPMPFCSCSAFKYSPFPKQPCKHLNLLAELQGQTLEQAIAPEYFGIDEQNVPHGCFLTRTDDDLSREYYVNCHVIERARGQERLTTKVVGRIIKGLNGIAAYRIRSGIYRSFTNTYSAVQFLVSSSDYRLGDVAAAYESYLDEQF